MDYTKDPRYGAPGWTLIHSGGRSYFVPVSTRKKRKSPRALRFALASVGDFVMHKSKWQTEAAQPPPMVGLSHANTNSITENHEARGLARIEHLWFDPVAGEHDETAGQMAAVRMVTSSGYSPHLYKHTLRGLASQGYFPISAERQRFLHDIIERREAIRSDFDLGRITHKEALFCMPPWWGVIAELDLIP